MAKNAHCLLSHNYVSIRSKLWYLHFIKWVFQATAKLLDEL